MERFQNQNQSNHYGQSQQRHATTTTHNKSLFKLNPMNQSALKAYTCSPSQARETRTSNSQLVLVLPLTG